MLESSFQHLRGIGPVRERQLWQSGITSWDKFDAAREQPLLPTFCRGEGFHLDASREALSRGEAGFFARRLPRREHYRIALAFPADTLFLDIETTGLSLYYDDITLAGWGIGSDYSVYVKGASDRGLRAALSRAKSLVTFNGSLFDVPFLRRVFPDLQFPEAHIDLRFLARRAGLPGPQKEVERKIGVDRDPDLQGISGREAPLLWHSYKRGDRDALRRLIQYNHADIEGMKLILDEALQRLLPQCDVPLFVRGSSRFSAAPARLVWRDGRERGGISVPRFQGAPGPAMQYDDLSNTPGLDTLRVVGIDLTGSESRGSGWCLLHGRETLTQVLHADEDLVGQTLAGEPDLVSIDSPLSLPVGRTRVTDDDPGREQYGITRECERELRRRGVNVYPSLIQSMQRLTERGIRLAARFRQHGVPVIESYPGAAQDILGIPRKRASLDLLKQGLVEFGLRGDWTGRTVTHDELDAITSAIVGLFFWADRYEALGNDEEEFLIVPVVSSEEPERKPIAIAFSGPICSGKTTAAKLLESAGFTYTRFSLVLADLLKSQGRQVNRETLQQLGEQVHHDPGQRWLCQKLLASAGEAHRIVIDGLRHPEDHSFLVERFGRHVTHLFIDTPADERRDRFVNRSGSRHQFDQVASHPVESNVAKLKNLAHHVIRNDRSESDFQEEVREFALASMGGG